LAPWLKRFPFAVLVPSALSGHSVRLRLASPEAVTPQILAMLAADLNLDAANLAYDDPARGVMRRVLHHDGRLAAYLLAGDTRAADALLQWADTGDTPANVSQILMGRHAAIARARIVCTCASVSDTDLHAAIQAGQDLEALKASLKCGITCGSCLPQIKRMIEHVHSTEPHT